MNELYTSCMQASIDRIYNNWGSIIRYRDKMHNKPKRR